MSLLLETVYCKPPEDSGGRSMGVCTRNDGQTFDVLLEWRTSTPAGLEENLRDVLDNIPIDEDANRPEETRTLKIEGIFNEAQRTAIAYRCPRQPLNLRDVLQKIKKPSGDDRRILASVIANQVRSLHVHFRLQHTALRTESFVFQGDANKPDFANPYILDWGRPSFPSIYQHPEYQAAEPHWFYDVWSLMIVLSEIAEWQLVDGAFRDEGELLRKKLERSRKVMDPDWKGRRAAKIFEHGFGLFEKDGHALEQFSKRDIKRFFDKLCELLEMSVME